MKQICWIADVPGWAYDNRARALMKQLPGYEHVVIYNIVQRFDEAIVPLSNADIIVCPDPRILCFVPSRANVIQHINTFKIF